MAPSMRQRLEEGEDARLAPWAARAGSASRRYRIENEGRLFDYRTHFQRDRDRIVYSRAFRRLRQKAQSGILPDYEDHRRNRLTHTLEVTQLARTVGRALQLNEDLVEAIALGHDLGQPPFGAAGERALDDLLRGVLDGRGGAGLGFLSGFRRNWQSLRVVDGLEKRYAHPGLNLTDEVREGILKSGELTGMPTEGIEGVRWGMPPLFEMQTVVVADRIATAIHDLDDALQSSAISLEQVERLPAVRELKRKLGDRYPARGGRFMRINAIHRGLTHLLVTATILDSERRLGQWATRHAIADAAAFRETGPAAIEGHEIALSAGAQQLLDQLDSFLDRRVRSGFDADRVDGRGRRVILGLFAAYFCDPTLLEAHVLLRFKEQAKLRYLRDLPRPEVESEIHRRYRTSPGFVRLLADYLAGMTDAFALAEHRRLHEMGAVPIPSVEQFRREAVRTPETP